MFEIRRVWLSLVPLSKSELNQKWFMLELSCKNNVFYPIFQLFESKSRRRIYGYLYFETKMGVAGLMIEPHPPNFEKLYNFLRCSNDVKKIF